MICCHLIRILYRCYGWKRRRLLYRLCLRHKLVTCRDLVSVYFLASIRKEELPPPLFFMSFKVFPFYFIVFVLMLFLFSFDFVCSQGRAINSRVSYLVRVTPGLKILFIRFFKISNTAPTRRWFSSTRSSRGRSCARPPARLLPSYQRKKHSNMGYMLRFTN